ncbi:uncharacterized protein LOC142791432 [Rhipicephalus microplus]|uniref:uncharacterized protein LOC142791432 n=1 Tax=Rhipicephalus microplus TaxID=6941 RepID=UPI003F6D990C
MSESELQSPGYGSDLNVQLPGQGQVEAGFSTRRSQPAFAHRHHWTNGGKTICLGSVNAQRNRLLDYVYPAWTGVIQLAIVLCCIVAVITQVMRTFAENGHDIYVAMEPEDGYGPADPEMFARYQSALPGRNVIPSTIIAAGKGGRRSLQRTSFSVCPIDAN